MRSGAALPFKRCAFHLRYSPADGNKRRYVEPESDKEITARLKRHKEVKDDIRERRRLVEMLLRSGGMASPDRFAGEVTKTLADAASSVFVRS